MVWPFLAGATVLLGLTILSIHLLSGARAYVEGESLWSKAQKEAVFHLNRYALSHDEADFAAYLKEISVPLGDRKAREALQRAPPKARLARQGFLEGRNHPEDIDDMIRLFVHFQDISFMRKPIAIWTEGDQHIAALTAEANQLHAAILSGNATAQVTRDILERVRLINKGLTPLEENFSASLGHATRSIADLLQIFMLLIATASLCFGSYVSHLVLVRKEAAEEDLRSMTAYAATEQERRESEGRIREQAALLDKARDAIVVRDLADRVLYWNKGAERLYGVSAHEAHGTAFEKLVCDDPAAFRRASAAVLAVGSWNGEFQTRRKDGTIQTVESRWTLVCDDEGVASSILAIDTDVSDRKLAEDDSRRLAFYDPLTHLPNRMLLQDRLQQALATSSHNNCAGALLFIDLDNFKSLNDTLGHETGDMLLQQVAHRLTHCVRESDTVARLGGDEFVIMLADLHERREDVALRAKSVCEKILDHLRQPYSIAGNEQHSAASIGVALFEGRQDTVGDLLKRADLAMYQAKAAGRNTVRFYNEDMQAAVSARAAMETDLRLGLRDHQFFLHYQPQINEDGRMIGTEALLRWRHPQHGLIPPVRFISISEETGLILPLGQWVLETACAQLALWAAKPSTAQLSVAVNVSARQFHHEQFVEQIMQALEHSGANPERLKLEITESLFLEDVEATIAKMTALKSRGVRFSLDDFGTGYSSLSYLKRLPLDQLKIDQSFVRDVLTDFHDAAIARTIVILAQSLGLTVIAEGVETEEQRGFLSRNDCHLFQGYLFSPPLPADRLEAMCLE